MGDTAHSSVDPAEVARFATLAARWWDPRGPLGELHRMNPARLGFIRDACLARFGRDPAARAPFAGLTAIDIGCGGGLLTEPIARLGFRAMGLDATEEAVAVATAHAADAGLSIDYRRMTIEAARGEDLGPFDLVLALEIIEHVADPASFLKDCAALIAPGGLMILATLNRTFKSLALAKVAAEYLLRLAEPGTHDWRRFPRPDEVRAWLAGEPLEVGEPAGLSLDILTGRWRVTRDPAVNYILTIARPAL